MQLFYLVSIVQRCNKDAKQAIDVNSTVSFFFLYKLYLFCLFHFCFVYFCDLDVHIAYNLYAPCHGYLGTITHLVCHQKWNKCAVQFKVQLKIKQIEHKSTTLWFTYKYNSVVVVALFLIFLFCCGYCCCSNNLLIQKCACGHVNIIPSDSKNCCAHSQHRFCCCYCWPACIEIERLFYFHCFENQRKTNTNNCICLCTIQ